MTNGNHTDGNTMNGNTMNLDGNGNVNHNFRIPNTHASPALNSHISAAFATQLTNTSAISQPLSGDAAFVISNVIPNANPISTSAASATAPTVMSFVLTTSTEEVDNARHANEPHLQTLAASAPDVSDDDYTDSTSATSEGNDETNKHDPAKAEAKKQRQEERQAKRGKMSLEEKARKKVQRKAKSSTKTSSAAKAPPEHQKPKPKISSTIMQRFKESVTDIQPSAKN
eukprot:GDKJ01054556.1.p1 GENE.GDKJ01054556.1~~GDKJ01054556.1.p1  ORF type:complete len:266 (-),score=40.20 GDKJ01054556.1:16-699(-)